MPYSWDDEHDQGAADGQGYSFTDARRSYDDVAVAASARRAVYTYKSDLPKTDAEYPILIGIDTTGSMEEWPRTFFEKLPLLYREAVKYLPGCAISFQAINDFHADGEDVALQPAPFGKGPQLDEIIGQLYPVGGGGGQTKESYEIFAAYNSFLEAPNALIKPIAIILGDEQPWDPVPEAVCAHYGLSRGEGISAREAFARLHGKCDVFLVRKPYYDTRKEDEVITRVWRDTALIPSERILHIDDPRRVVDVILGILGILTGKVEHFEQELAERQEPDQVREVLDSLHAMKASVNAAVDASQRSRTLDLGAAGQKTWGLKLDG